MADVYSYGKTVDVPSKSLDSIANITLRRYNEAVLWQSQERVGSCSLRETLRNCYDQFNGILSCRDQEIVEAIGVDAYVNLSAMKAGVVQAFLLETLVQSDSLPWVISPTPVPSLSDTGRYEVLSQIQNEIYNNNFRGDLQELIRNVKAVTVRKEYEHAQTAAQAMERLMIDQCLEGGWNTAMYGLVTDFVVYPYAILSGPVPMRRHALQWSGDKVTHKAEIYYGFQSVSPWDFWYSPDSPDTQRGTGVFVRQRWTRQRLLDAARLPSYNRENILKVLKGVEVSKNRDLQWMSENPDQPDDYLALWADCSATIDVLIHYGYFSGRELRDYVSGLEDDEFYNATITVINGWTVQVVIPPNPNLDIRPIHTASFYKTHDRIPGASIPQRLRDVERVYLTALRYMVSNAANASGPVVEAEYGRLAKYASDTDLARIVPNTVYLADEALGSAGPALKFYSIPSIIPQYLQIMEYCMDLADRVTNIPAALHGIAVGSGVNRTFRGAAMLQNNASKSLQAAVRNLDQFIFTPLGQQLYNYNMQYWPDDSVKGDCKILAQGATGLLQREIDRQASYEILQLTAAAGNQLAQMPNGPAIMTWALNNVFKTMGVPQELLGSTAMQPAPVNSPVMGAPGPGPENTVTGTMDAAANPAEVPTTS